MPCCCFGKVYESAAHALPLVIGIHRHLPHLHNARFNRSQDEIADDFIPVPRNNMRVAGVGGKLLRRIRQAKRFAQDTEAQPQGFAVRFRVVFNLFNAHIVLYLLLPVQPHLVKISLPSPKLFRERGRG